MTPTPRAGFFRHGRDLAMLGAYLFLSSASSAPWLPASVVGFAAPVAVAAGTFIVLGIVRHDRALCGHCMAQMPLNPTAAAQRERPILKLAHLTRWNLAAMLALIIIGSFLLSTWWESNLAVSLAMVPLIAVVFSADRHSRLQPWCPYCRRRGFDAGLSEEAPAPTDGNRKPLPV